MNEQTATCPKCQSQMEQGFLLDHSYARVFISPWVRGAPSTTFFGGLKTGPSRDHIPVATFRCQTCGFLELYARSEFAAK